MRANLHEGKLVPPASAEAGKKRHQQLGHEIEKIERALNDLSREKRDFRTRTEYASWRTSAKANLGYLREEHKQLSSWLRNRGIAVAEVTPTVTPDHPEGGVPDPQVDEDFTRFWEE